MKKLFISLCFLAFVLVAIGQKHPVVGNPVKKYANDTVGFKAFPEVFLLENLKLPKAYKKLEMNTCVFLYIARGEKKSMDESRNLYRYPHDIQKTADTAVLSKWDPLKCFTACLCPYPIPWYIAAQTSDNEILNIGDSTATKLFLGNLDNKFNAYLWLRIHAGFSPLGLLGLDIPIKTSRYFKYKKEKDGFLIKCHTRISNAMAYADVTYFIDRNFRITIVSKKNEAYMHYII